MLRPMVITIAVAITLAPSSSPAQSTQPQESATEVLVFGDVAKSGVYQLPADQAVSASTLLENREINGFGNGPINIRVIRNGLKVALAARLEEGQKSDFQISNGDIVYVSSANGASAPKVGSRARVAVIHPDKVPLLPVVYTQKTTIEALLSHKSLNWQENKFRLIRTHPHANRAEPTKQTTLMPGDVLFVDRSAAADTKLPPSPPAISPVLPVLTSPPARPTEEPKPKPNTADTAVYKPGNQASPSNLVQVGQETPQPLLPEPVKANYGAVDGTPSAVSTQEDPPAIIPTLPQSTPVEASSTTQPITAPPADPSRTPSLDQDPWETNPPLSATTANLQNQTTDKTTSELEARINSSIPAFNAASTQVPGPPIGDTANYGSLESKPNTEADTGQPTAPTTATIPLPSELARETRNSESGATMWYVAGLLAALFVVLGAWIYGSRALAEGPQLRSAAAPQKRAIKKRVQTVSQAPLDGSLAAPETAKPPTPVLKPIVPQPAPSPIPAATQPVPQPIPQSAVPLSELPASLPSVPLIQPNVAQAPAVAAPLQHSPAPAPVTPAQAPTITLPQAASASAPPDVAPTAVPAQPEPIPVPNTRTTHVLDALVNNSIPVREAPVQLPTHLEFFGDSQGPRQLRIDPAQARLQGPHLGLKAGLESKQATPTSRGESAE